MGAKRRGNRAGRRGQQGWMENDEGGQRGDSTRSASTDLFFHPHTQQLQRPSETPY